MLSRKLMPLLAAGAVAFLGGAALAEPAAVVTDLNMRSGPSTSYRVITVLPRGTVVDVIGCRARWCEVEWRGRAGFVSERYLADVRAPVRPPPVQPGPPSIVIPLPGFGIDIRPGRPDGYERPRPRICDDRRVQWLVGERARRSVIDRAAEISGARTVRVVAPGEFVTQDYRRDRLTIRVDWRDRIIDLRCG